MMMVVVMMMMVMIVMMMTIVMMMLTLSLLGLWGLERRDPGPTVIGVMFGGK